MKTTIQIQSATHGHQMSSTNTVPTHTPTNQSDMWRHMTDQYGRRYLQTPNGRIY